MANQSPQAVMETVNHALRILNELVDALDHANAPELCRNLEELYGFAARRLVTGSEKMEAAAVEDAEQVVQTLRAAFADAANVATQGG